MFDYCTHCGEAFNHSDDEMVTYPLAAIIVEDSIPQRKLVFCDWHCVGQYSALMEVEND